MTAPSSDSLLAQQLEAIGVSLTEQDRIMAELGRGQRPAAVTEQLLARGYSQGLAVSVVEILARRQAGPSAAGRGYQAEPSRIGPVNALSLDGRRVAVVARLEHPDLVVLEGLLSDEECAALIQLSRDRLQRSTIVNRRDGSFEAVAGRSSEGCYFPRGENPLIARLDRRLAELTGIPEDHGEGLQILRYGVGGEYRTHFDYFRPDDPGSAVLRENGGQRVATVVMYLNDVAAGGETSFPNLGGFRVVPRRGAATYFAYCDALGQVDPLTLHAGAPVRAGEKWIATKWLRQGRYEC